MMYDWNNTGKLEGDCDDIAMFHGAVLKAAGEDPEFHALRMTGDVEFSHVYCIARGFIFDPVVPVGTAFPDVSERIIVRI